jgi:azurin
MKLRGGGERLVDMLKVLELVKAVFMVKCVFNGHLALECEV